VGWSALTDADDRPYLRAGVILAESTARRLGVNAGEEVEGRVDRVYKGRRESAALPLKVLSVLPPEARSTDATVVPLELLVASEDYRDGRAVPFLGWPGDDPDPDGQRAAPDAAHALNAADASPRPDPAAALRLYAEQIRTGREYASFRLYARGLDDVAPLWRRFQQRNIEVYVRVAEIETVQSLDTAFTVVFSLITGAALFGFCASTAGSALAGVRRKSRSLGLMSLMGFPRRGILLFPLVQTVTTGVLGFFLALGLYFGVAVSINRFFAPSLPGGEAVCSLPPAHALAALGAVIVLSALSSLSAAWQATTIEPSEVIRDV
jgi:putative ABC transport system permease protein